MEPALWMGRTSSHIMFSKSLHITIAAILLWLSILPVPVIADEENSNRPLNAAMGFLGSISYNDVNIIKGDADYRQNIGYGCGLVFETMFSNLFGIHSGIHYSFVELTFSYPSEDLTFTHDTKVRFHTLDLPLCMIFSFNTEKTSVQILLGGTFSQILSAKMYTEDPYLPDSSDDVLSYLNHTRIAVTAGLLFKFRVTRFSDFFFGVMTDYYFTDLFVDESVMHHNPFDAKAVFGWLFRTNVFPMSDNE